MPATPARLWKLIGALAAVAVVISGLVGALLVWYLVAPDSPEAAPEPSGPWATTSHTPQVSLGFSQADGPEIIDIGGATVERLGLRWVGEYGEAEGEAGCKASGTCLLMEDGKLAWTRSDDGPRHSFVGTHAGQRATVVATWTVEDGSPTVTLDIEATWSVDSYPDREALVLTTSRAVDSVGRDLGSAPVEPGNRAYADALTPHIARFGQGTALPAEFVAWGFEGLEVHAAPGSTELFLELDDARSHPFRPSADCTTERGRNTRSARDRRLRPAGTKSTWRAALRLGEGWTPTPWRNPEGRAAAIAVVDAAPGTSAHRLRTLLWGHSNTADPRYGNGGFLGHRLPMTKGIHTGPRGMGSSRFSETVRRAAGTGVKFANQSATSEEDEPALNEAGMDILATVDARVWIDAGNGCEDFFGNGWRKGRLAEPLAAHGYRWIWAATDEPWSAGAGLNQLRANRRGMRTPVLWRHDAARHEFGFFQTLDLSFGKERVARALAESQLQRLIQERGVSIVRTAFDRTTVSDVLAESGMIVREDNGHYVLDGELEKVLFDMEDFSGRGQLWVTTVEELGDRYRALGTVNVHPTPSGAVAVTNDGPDRITDWSVAVPGATVNVDGSPPKGSTTYGDVRVVWFDLAPGATVIVEARDATGELIPAAHPLRWTPGPKAALAAAP